MASKLPKLKIKKGAKVKVIAGSERGAEGAVLEVNPRTMKIRVQGISLKTHFDKKDGLKKVEGFIDYSNVKMLSAAPEKKPVKKTKSKTATKKKQDDANA